MSIYKHGLGKTTKADKWLFVVSVILLSGCTTAGFIDYTSIPGNVLPHNDYSPAWEQVYPGLEAASWIQNSPNLVINALKIDLNHPGRDIFVTPGNKTVDRREKNFSSRTTGKFLEDFNCIAAINATPYYPFRFFQGFTQKAVGVVISDGILYSSSSDYAVFSISKDNKVRFTEPPFNNIDSFDIDQAAGGFFIILKDGENISSTGNRNPLSIVGVSKSGQYLFLVVVDGEDRDWSIGASLWEGAEWMAAFGAYNAMILDGGGSSTLVIRGKNGKSLLLNKPSGANIFYRERPVAVHIGVR